MTPLDKQKQFYKELKELLVKYDAEIELEDVGRGYSSDYQIIVEFNYDNSFYPLHKTGVVPKLVLGSYENGKV